MVAGPLTIVQMLPELYAGGVERGTLELAKYLAEKARRLYEDMPHRSSLLHKQGEVGCYQG